MEEQEESWSGCDPLRAKPEITLHMALVWGQNWATSEYSYCCCTAGEPVVKAIVAVVGTVVVVAERLVAGRSELAPG